MSEPTTERTTTAEAIPRADVATPEPVAEARPSVAEIRVRAARGVAHRVRTPLSLVIGPLHQAFDDSSLDDRTRAQLRIALEQAEQVRDGIEELAMLGAWTDDGEPGLGRVGELLGDVALSCLAGVTCDGLTYDVQPDDTLEARVDPALLRYALSVLVRDVVDVCGADGHVRLRAEDAGDHVRTTIAVDAEPEHGVSDERPMIDVVRMIATRHGGTVRSTGALGWELRVPAVGRSGDEEVGPTTVPHVPPDTSRPATRREATTEVVGPDGAPLVLLVEDDAVLRGYLADALSSEHRVVAATSAEEAVSIVDRMRPDLMVLDLLLPGVGGEQMLRDLRGDPELAAIPVVVVSGSNDDAQRVRVLRDGVDDYVAKPFSIGELRARVQNVLSRSGSLDDLRERTARAQEVADQLQRALDSRVVIEQAKAFVAVDRGVSVEEAFELMRRHARSHNRKLRDVAEAVVQGFRP